MDETLLPGSFNFIKRNLPGLVGASLGAFAENLRLGRKQAQLAARERTRPVTWQGEQPRPSMKNTMRMRVPRRRVYRKRRYSYRKPGMSNDYRRIVRTSGAGAITITASTFTSSFSNIALNAVQTSDLTSLYRYYRIRKVVLHLTPRVDPANSGLSNNFTTFIAAACDPEGATVAPPNMQGMTAYDNSRSLWINSGEEFKYTFYPKAVNTVDIGGTASAVGGYGMNPWLLLNSTGITVPHRQLILAAQVGAPTTVTYDYFYDVHFDVKGFA